ncbi:sigma factor G inhibitor Gin [Paenibacillus chungangensis]|uniref:Sigma factor G inhibitor Gin n=1 Tax=Paenibacillus chungangensis TaxID=696535 RepID=A0ABW3HVF6_9BACL
MNELYGYQCAICGNRRIEGEGIRVIYGFICEDCETEMVHTDVRDAKYPFFIHQMKQIFIEKNA